MRQPHLHRRGLLVLAALIGCLASPVSAQSSPSDGEGALPGLAELSALAPPRAAPAGSLEIKQDVGGAVQIVWTFGATRRVATLSSAIQRAELLDWRELPDRGEWVALVRGWSRLLCPDGTWREMLVISNPQRGAVRAGAPCGQGGARLEVSSGGDRFLVLLPGDIQRAVNGIMMAPAEFTPEPLRAASPEVGSGLGVDEREAPRQLGIQVSSSTP